MLTRFKWYRKLIGGTWYKHRMTGQLPGIYGTFWTTYPSLNRYTYVIEIENYELEN